MAAQDEAEQIQCNRMLMVSSLFVSLYLLLSCLDEQCGCVKPCLQLQMQADQSTMHQAQKLCRTERVHAELRAR